MAGDTDPLVVTSPDGDVWTVGVRLLHRQPRQPRRRWRWRRGRPDASTVADAAVDTAVDTAGELAVRSVVRGVGQVAVGPGDTAGAAAGDAGGSLLDGFDLGDAMALVLVVVGVVAVAWFAISWVLPLLVLAGEVVLLLALAGLGALWRTVTRSPWTVHATSLAGGEHTWRVVGYRAAREHARRAARALAAGTTLPPRV